MQEGTPPYIDRAGGSTMHRDRDARQEARHLVPQGARSVLFDEELLIPRALLKRLDMEHLAAAGWLPLSLENGLARVAAVNPEDPAVAEDARGILGAERVELLHISAADLAQTLANNEDVNPGFPAEANRTSLARVRTHLANRRSMLASRRTIFAKGRTGLAMFRTGLAFATGLLLLLRIAGLGWTSPIQLCLLAAGLFLIIDGLRWYLPARRLSLRGTASGLPQAAPGVTVLFAVLKDFRPIFGRSAPVAGAEAQCAGWDGLSPVMRRRLLALDRTNLAEERTLLAFLRTLMAKSRTGMALGRTGVALAGIGAALIRQYRSGGVDPGWALIAVGVVMTLEGLSWYLPGRTAGKRSMESTARAEGGRTPWGLVLPPESAAPGEPETAGRDPRGGVQGGVTPGVWGSTGLALERSLLAERRNVMARLRTHMARARTGLSFIRTGMNFTAVGLGLLVSFGFSSLGWTALETAVLGLGVLLVADGLYWHLPADKVRRALPYCYHGLEIALPDYARPVGEWPKTEFDNACK